MKTILMISILFLNGCVGSKMIQTYDGGPHAPTNRKKGGTVSYFAAAVKPIIEKRRQDAYRKMSEYCQSPYHIVTEGIVNQTSEEWQIQFECDE